MKKETIAAIGIGLVGIILFTGLLWAEKISETSYVVLIIPLALVCITVVCLPRLKELNLKDWKITLNELKQVKADIEEMYGGIDNLKREPLILDEAKQEELGIGRVKCAATSSAVMRYTAGCMKRERERLARIFVNEKPPAKLAEAIMDNTLDDKVFKWNGPESPLDKEPVSSDERQKQEKENKS